MNKVIVKVLLLLGGFIAQVHGQIILETDFTDDSKATSAMHDHLDVYNRISPLNGFTSPVTENASLCIVRPLGGIYKDGGPDLSLDSYLWNEATQEFYTDFTLLKQQIDGVFNKGIGIHQIVLDNPSWAFQRDASGNLVGGALKVSTYGNAEPPRDFDAWALYLKEVMNYLIATYGEQEMLKIQFGIGREIGTAGHWTGTKEQFFDFYQKSVMAIHEVLPQAKVGSHFLWGTASNSWGDDFVKWCKTNDVHYDVIGVSFYPFYDRANRTNLSEVYSANFATIKDIPEWNENAVLEMHEFALIESMSSQGNAYVSADAAHQNSFLVGMMKMFYEHNMKNLFQWGSGAQYMPANTEISKLEGSIYYRNTKNGNQQSPNNYVDAIFAKDTVLEQYNILASNYNAGPTSNVSETLNLVATIDAPSGTNVKYRVAVYDKVNGTLPWSAWQNAVTEGSLSNKSTVNFTNQLPVFSFLKYEFIVSDEYPDAIDSSALVDKLVFYYPLENDGKDASENNNHASLGSAVTFSSGKSGNGAVFSYTNGSSLSSADNVFKYSYPTAYTIAFWLRVDDYSKRGDILQPVGGRTLLYSNGDLSFKSYHQKQPISFSVTDEEKGEWFHVVMVIDQREGQTQHKFYRNGVQQGTVAQGYLLETDKPQSIGRLIFGSSSDANLQNNFTGMLDEIYMFDSILSDDEISFLMNSENLIEDTLGNEDIHNINRSNKMKLFPVPANDMLNIGGVNVDEAHIYNMLGVLVKVCITTNNQIDVSSLKRGMYILKGIDRNGNSSVNNFIKY